MKINTLYLFYIYLNSLVPLAGEGSSFSRETWPRWHNYNLFNNKNICKHRKKHGLYTYNILHIHNGILSVFFPFFSHIWIRIIALSCTNISQLSCSGFQNLWFSLRYGHLLMLCSTPPIAYVFLTFCQWKQGTLMEYISNYVITCFQSVEHNNKL